MTMPLDPELPLFEDAEETVQAIHQGDIDAVVVMRALKGPEVILLHGAEEPYRALVEGDPPKLVPEVTAEASLLRNGDDAMPVAVWSRPMAIGNTTAILVRLTD